MKLKEVDLPTNLFTIIFTIPIINHLGKDQSTTRSLFCLLVLCTFCHQVLD